MEVCFCGREGEIVDREPVYLGDGEWGLACPDCGHLDRLDGWPAAGRSWTLAEAARRRAGAATAGTVVKPAASR